MAVVEVMMPDHVGTFTLPSRCGFALQLGGYFVRVDRTMIHRPFASV